jgi:hypothetical protein
MNNKRYAFPLQATLSCSLSAWGFLSGSISSRIIPQQKRRLRPHFWAPLACIMAVFCAQGAVCATPRHLAVYPSSASIPAGTEQVFEAQLSGVPDTHQVTYEVDGIPGGDATVGTITNAGVYKAPKSPGTHTVTITDSIVGQSARAVFFVFSEIKVNFGSRSTSLHPIPSNLIGIGRMDSLHNIADLDMVKSAGINYSRIYANVPQVFKTTKPHWASIDNNVRKISEGGVHVMLQIFQTPPWLLPKTNPCGSGYPAADAPPTDFAAWADVAVQYVKHMDETFPGVVTDYEIWNEPNVGSFCVPTASKLSTYLKLYNAAAPLMRAQIKLDGSNARVGGPATTGLNTAWTKALLSDPVASQNIDFLGYHGYLFNISELNAEWDRYNKTSSVYQRTQDSGAGPAQTYRRAAALVAAGKQPQGKDLPIYQTEYNLNWAFNQTCCRNHPTYSPVWNGLFIADILNSVYTGAPHAMGHMVYFASTGEPYFCIIGEINPALDCAYPVGSTPQPYPQFFLTELIGSPKYLGLQDGGYMAESISPYIRSNGPVVTAFFNSNLDAIVLINPSQYSYADIPVRLENTGMYAPTGTLYSINNGEIIRSSSLDLTSKGGTSYTTSVTLPPYSVQAISIHH